MLLRIQVLCQTFFIKKMRTVKLFMIFCFTSFAFVLLMSNFFTNDRSRFDDDLVVEAINNVGRDLRFTNVYRGTRYLPKNMKYILLWSGSTYAPFSELEEGQRSFLKNNCSKINCYVSANIHLFGPYNYTQFNAVAFNGRTMKPYRLPRLRSLKQKYIYFNTESSDYYPVCHSNFDGFFNLTATYRLDSDIKIKYIEIQNKKGKVVGPKSNMQWIKYMKEVDKAYSDRLSNKTKAAAWFVSNCNARSRRQDFVDALINALYDYGYTIDIYGACGYLTCPRDKEIDCNFLLKRDYFFYMSLENSFSEDYVTEKLLTALNNDVVPIVYGGADYSRFLPPGSYIDARKYSIYELAAAINRLIHSPKAYSQFFRWKAYYTYYYDSSNICRICETLNDVSIIQKTTTYERFRHWWNPEYIERCQR